MPYLVASEVEPFIDPVAAVAMAIPAGHQANDILVAIVTQDGGGTVIAATASGWTQIGTQAAAQAQRTTAFWRLATSSAEPDFTATGAADDWVISIYVIRAANTSAPINVQLRTDSANSTTAFLDSGSVVTTQDGCLVLYAWGFDGLFKMLPETPADLNFLIKLSSTGGGCTQIAGYRNQVTAGTSPSLRALVEAATEGGQALVIAIEDVNPSAPQLGPSGLETYTVVKRYGGLSTGTASAQAFIRHDSITWQSVASLAATTIAGRALLALTFAEGVHQATDSPWGTMTGLGMSGSAIDATGRWVGMTHAMSATDMSNSIFSLEVMMSTVAPAHFGSQGIAVVFQDGAGAWVAFQVTPRAGLAQIINYTWQVDLQNTTPLDSSGTINWSNITRLGYLFHKITTATTANTLRIKNALLLRRTTLVDGCAAAPCSPALAAQLMGGWGPVGVAALQGAGQALWRSGVRYGDGSRKTHLVAGATSYELPLRAASSIGRRFWVVASNALPADFEIHASASDVVDLRACLMATDLPQTWRVNAATSLSATYLFAGAVLVGWSVVNPVLTLDAVTLQRCPTITLNGGGLDRCQLLGCGPLTTDDPSNIADTGFVSPGTGHAIVLTDTGTFAFEGNEFSGYGADASTDAAIYNNSGGAVTLVLLASDQFPTVRNGAGASTSLVVVSFVEVVGVGAGDTVEMRREDTHAVLETRTGPGTIDVAAHIGLDVYFARIVSGQTIATTFIEPITLVFGDNGEVPLYVGSEVKVADLPTVEAGLTVINQGVQRASLLIPHTVNWP
jgi:hypothetical protein